MPLIRLNKAIADSGLCARRKADELIEAHRVQVNGEPVSELGHKIDPEQDVITVDGHPLPSLNKVYLVFHKPAGVVTSRKTGRNQQSIYTLLPPEVQHADPAGRLDQDSSGLLILSSDGDFLNRITHPRYHLPKTYQVTLHRSLENEHRQQLKDGVMLEPEHKLARMAAIRSLPRKANTYEITLITGYNRQIRRSFELLGYKVKTLHRISFGPITLGDLPLKALRPLTPTERRQLTPAAPTPTISPASAAPRPRAFSPGGSAKTKGTRRPK